jgi:uncharacterized cupredoxin-like copper-binding protein
MRFDSYLTTLRSLALPVAAGAVAILLGAAGAHADSSPNSGAHGHGASGQATAFGMPGSAAKITRTIKVEATDMKYSFTSLTVKAGETIRFVVTNKGEVEHDFTIGDAAAQKAHREEMAKMMDGTMDHGPGGMHHDDANAAFVKPGETKEFIWSFTRAGTFEFACNVPGHYEAGMKGPLVVSGAGSTKK